MMMERQNDNAMVRATDTIENSLTLTGRSQAHAKREARRQSRSLSSGCTARVTRSQKKRRAEAQTSRKPFRYQRSPRPHARLRPPSQKNCGANWRAQSNVKIALQFASSLRWLFRSASWVSQALSVATNLLVSRQRRDPNAAASSAHSLVGLKPWLNTHLRDNLTLFSNVNNALTLVDQAYVAGGLDCACASGGRMSCPCPCTCPCRCRCPCPGSPVQCPVSRVPCPCQRVVLRWCGVDPRTRDTDLQTHTHTQTHVTTSADTALKTRLEHQEHQEHMFLPLQKP